MTTSVRIGVIGCGALGRHHVRILSRLPGAELVGVYDRDPDVARVVAAEHGATHFCSLEDLVDEGLEAAVVAVPTVDHAAVGKALLGAGIHVLVEKPIASSLEEADELIAAAAEAGRILAVGHVEFFNPAVQALLAAGLHPGFVEVQRLGTFSPRSLDIDVVLDLMIHDLQILHALDPSPVHEIRAVGVRVLSDRVDIANVRVELASGCVANLTASRVSAEKVRKLRVFEGAGGYFSLDYPEQEIKGYRLEPRDGSREIVRADLPVTKSEPLAAELAAFVAACRGDAGTVIVSGEAGRQALATAREILQAIPE